MYKQLIIARKDLEMSPGKLSAQVSHASMAFLSLFIRNNSDLDGHVDGYFDQGILDNWINDAFTKTVCGAKNLYQLMKAKTMAENMGMKENEDFFIIADCCRTELEPEFIDKNGVGRTITCIGFRPFPEEVIDQIGKKYQLLR